MKMKGVVSAFFPGRGYGFVTAEDGEDYFFHIKDAKRNDPGDYPEEGQEVEITGFYESGKGCRARIKL